MSNIVDNVFFMEVPDIYKYVDPYGLLLTTLYPISENEEAIQSFIPNLVEKKVSCVALKLGRYIDDVPPVMIEQADYYRIPLMILPKNANLSKLSNNILELFLGNKTSMLEYRDNIHSKLMSLLLEGADLHKLVITVSTLFNKPVLFVDQYLHIQSTSFGDTEDNIIVKRHEENEWDTPLSPLDLTVLVNGREYNAHQVLYQSIVAGGKCLGYLIALLEEKSDLSDLIIGLEQASMLCAFLFQRELALRQNERNYLDAFIRDVLNEKFTHQAEVVEKAKFFDWDLSFPMLILAIEVLDDDESFQRIIYSDMLSESVVEQLIVQSLGLSSRHCKMVFHGEVLLCLISAPSIEDMQDKLEESCNHINKYYRQRFHLGFGISNVVYHLDQLKTAKEEAQFALDITKRLRGYLVPFIAFYDQTGIYKMLHHITELEVLRQYVDEKLGRLLNNGSKETDLLETLLALLKNGFNLQKTAKELYIHYNTLRYRIEKLKQHGIDATDGLEVAELALAYQMHTYLLTVDKQ